MHRFFTAPENITDKKAILRGTDVAHIRTVLRLKSGDRVQILDGCGNCYTVTLTRLECDGIESRIDFKENMDNCESSLMIRLGQGMVKGTRFDGIVRRAVELGVGQVVPVSANRCVSKLSTKNTIKKIERWQRIASEAAKQCGRSRVPDIGFKPISVKEFCYANREADLRLIFWEEERSTRIRDLPYRNDLKSAAVLIGPEGGFSDSERARLRGLDWSRPVALGPRILRADTAAVAAMTLWQKALGDWA